MFLAFYTIIFFLSLTKYISNQITFKLILLIVYPFLTMLLLFYGFKRKTIYKELCIRRSITYVYYKFLFMILCHEFKVNKNWNVKSYKKFLNIFHFIGIAYCLLKRKKNYKVQAECFHCFYVGVCLNYEFLLVQKVYYLRFECDACFVAINLSFQA